MYYMPQVSPLPAELTTERWDADRAIEQVNADDGRPYFGFISFIGPHPPLAPPIPYNRMYDPDRMPNPVRGSLDVDHADEQIPWMNHAVYAEDVGDPLARVLKARYYGEITYIDDCIGRILDAVEARGDADDTLICFFSDHGDHLGDHHAWQKESYFEASCHIPFLISWPGQVQADRRRDELVCLTDLFGIATHAAGQTQVREGIDVLAMLAGDAEPRSHVVGMYGEPGTALFKIMVRDDEWKSIYLANGGREQLFHVATDPREADNRADDRREVVERLRGLAVEACRVPGAADALDGDGLRALPFHRRPLVRIAQFDRSRGVTGFPDKPAEVVYQRPAAATRPA